MSNNGLFPVKNPLLSAILKVKEKYGPVISETE